MIAAQVNFANEKLEVAQMINKVSSHPSVVRYGWCVFSLPPPPLLSPRRRVFRVDGR